MMLTDPTIIRDFLGFDDMTDINDAIDAALTSATSTLASRLNTTFQRSTGKDMFFVEAPFRQVGYLQQTEFRLSKGFIHAITKWDHATEIGSTDATSAVGDIITNNDKGIVKDMQTDYTLRFVQAEYTYGFEPSATDPEMYDLTQVPDWLQEAAKLSALMNLEHNPSLKAIDEGAGGTPTRVFSIPLQNLMAEHARYAPLAQIPVA